jgi:hypothetical protein
MATHAADAGDFLAFDQARSLLDNHDQHNLDAGLAEGDFIRSEFFGADSIRRLLDKPGATGVRVHHIRRWQDKNGDPTTPGEGKLMNRVVMVAADAEGNDMFRRLSSDSDSDSGDEAVGGILPCPPHC